MGKRNRKAFWHNVKFKYKLTIINENTLEEVVGIHVSKLNGLSVLLCVCTAIFVIAALIITFTPLRNYLPGYMNSEVRKQVVSNALRADSLRLALERQNHYIMNVQDIISGRVKADTVLSIDSLTNVRAENLMERTKEEEDFRKQYEEKERYNLTAVRDVSDAAGLIFYRPLRGVATTAFNPEKKHFGIDFTASLNGSILSALDGTVILAAYTAEAGYVIQIQHTQNFITVYKHCGSLIKREGDRVKGGEVIALVGTKGDTENGKPYIHFELWHKGNPINPEKYIVF